MKYFVMVCYDDSEWSIHNNYHTEQEAVEAAQRLMQSVNNIHPLDIMVVSCIATRDTLEY